MQAESASSLFQAPTTPAPPPAPAAPAQQQSRPTAKVKGNTVTYTYPDGSKVVLKGDHPFRDNNPGDLIAGRGTIGTDSGGGNKMAIFPTAADGWAAMGSLITNKYGNSSIIDMMNSYAPSSDGNDPAKYAATLAAAVGVSATTKISALTPAQLTTVEVNIAHVEGYFNSKNTMTYTAPPQ